MNDVELNRFYVCVVKKWIQDHGVEWNPLMFTFSATNTGPGTFHDFVITSWDVPNIRQPTNADLIRYNVRLDPRPDGFHNMVIY
jgi:hypothetical protein